MERMHELLRPIETLFFPDELSDVLEILHKGLHLRMPGLVVLGPQN